MNDRLSLRERNLLSRRQKEILTRKRTAAAEAEKRSAAAHEAFLRDCMPLVRRRLAEYRASLYARRRRRPPK